MRQGRPSWTARWVASQRAALASGRPIHGDVAAEARLYRDLALPGLGSRAVAPAGMAARTEFFDRQVVDAAVIGIRQIVLLGAGYDGRPLRFGDYQVRWIEVDHPTSQADKRRRLSRIGARVDNISFAPVDLSKDDLDRALEAAGHRPDEPTLWIAEGLLAYLTEDSIRSMFATLRRRSLPRSVLAVNVLVLGESSPAREIVRRFVDGLLSAIGEPRLTSFRDGDIERLLVDAGWKVEERSKRAELRGHGSHLLAVSAVY